jgi:uncharacterized protein
MINQTQQDLVIQYLRPLKPIKIGIFGSYARGQNKRDSDLDILVYLDYSNRISLLDLIGAEQDLTAALGIKVDLVTEKSLNPYIRPYIEKDVTIIYE